MVVSVALDSGHDNPQLIFESLNSTGLSLTQADLVRNYVLMGHAEQTQAEWYEKYWKPLEGVFGASYRDLFDGFLRDFLTLETRPAKPLKLDTVYRRVPALILAFSQSDSASHASNRAFGAPPAIRQLLLQVSFGPGRRSELEEAMARLRELVDVAAPLVMVLYECFEHEKSLSETEFVDALNVIESYVFRRSVVGAETRSGGAVFATLAYKVDFKTPLGTLKAQLARLGRNMVFRMTRSSVRR